MRKCPVAGCRTEISERMAMCARHWRKLLPQTRDMLNATYRRYADDEISAMEMKCVVAEVIGNLGGSDDDNTTPLTAVVGTCWCGKTLIFPRNGGSFTQDDNGLYVIVGGEWQTQSGKPKALARFAKHWCPPMVKIEINVKERRRFFHAKAGE